MSLLPFLFAACGSVVPSSDYAYSPAYTQYGGAYGSYSYNTSSGLISKFLKRLLPSYSKYSYQFAVMRNVILM